MKDSIFELVKKSLLFCILFKFFTMAVSYCFSASQNIFSNFRGLYYSVEILQIFYLTANLIILSMVALQYFKLFMSFISKDENKANMHVIDEEERDKRLFNRQVRFIVINIMLSLFMSTLVQIFNVFGY